MVTGPPAKGGVPSRSTCLPGTRRGGFRFFGLSAAYLKDERARSGKDKHGMCAGLRVQRACGLQPPIPPPLQPSIHWRKASQHRPFLLESSTDLHVMFLGLKQRRAAAVSKKMSGCQCDCNAFGKVSICFDFTICLCIVLIMGPEHHRVNHLISHCLKKITLIRKTSLDGHMMEDLSLVSAHKRQDRNTWPYIYFVYVHLYLYKYVCM